MIDFIKLIKLSYRDFKEKKGVKDISGIYCYIGEFGDGKTCSAVRDLKDLYDKGFNIYSNINLSFQNNRLEHWKDIINVPENSAILIDEAGDTFNSRAWSKMPREIFGYVVQNRKRNVRVILTAQEFGDIDKSIRGKCKYVIECSHLGRLMKNKYWKRKKYELSPTTKGRKIEFTVRYIREDNFAEFYNTHEIVKSLEGMA